MKGSEMGTSSAAFERLGDTRVVVVVRASRTSGISRLAGALAEAGLDIFEVTMTTPGALDGIEEIRTRHPRILVGAGTVLDVESARRALDAGAQFIVSPTFDIGVVETAKEQDILAIPGALTPTEAFTAWSAGIDVVKIFPASLGGPAYIRALLGPLPDLRFLPTGGVTAATATDYLEAGAYAVCLGTSFLDAGALERGEYDRVVREAEGLARRVRGVVMRPSEL